MGSCSSMSFMVALDIEIMTGCLERGGRLTIKFSSSIGPADCSEVFVATLNMGRGWASVIFASNHTRKEGEKQAETRNSVRLVKDTEVAYSLKHPVFIGSMSITHVFL